MFPIVLHLTIVLAMTLVITKSNALAANLFAHINCKLFENSRAQQNFVSVEVTIASKHCA